MDRGTAVGGILLALVLAVDLAEAQTNWQLANGGTCPSTNGRYCYDAARDQILRVTLNSTEILVGPNPVYVPSGISFSMFSGIAYDRIRQQVVADDGSRTWLWSGTRWHATPTRPLPGLSFSHVFAHSGRGTVMAFGGPEYWRSNDLYEWDGTRWNVIPAVVRPPRPGGLYNSLVYLGCGYDARRDKVVLDGGRNFDWSAWWWGNSVPVSTTWEWDAVNGWVQRQVQGPAGYPNILFFDTHRGVLTRLQGWRPVAVAEWDGGNAWRPITTASVMDNASGGDYHLLEGRYYTEASYNGPYGYSVCPHVYATISPARIQSLSPGCPGSLGEPTLRLSRDWTRAWLGGALSVEFTNLPQTAGLIAAGWSNQWAGTVALPLDLAPYGMPGCFARSSVDALFIVAGSANAATLTIPIPVHGTLLGVPLYQQGFALDPAANTAGLTASNLVRSIVGRL